jgi:hypothetical protein
MRLTLLGTGDARPTTSIWRCNLDELQPASVVLTHVGHTLDAWLMEHSGELAGNVSVGFDGCVV